MTLELAARLAVLLACAVAAGALYVRLARPRAVPVPEATSAPSPRPVTGAVEVALGAFIVVAGGAATAGIGFGTGAEVAPAMLRLAGIGLLALAGLLTLVPLPGRGRLGAPALVGLAWLGAGLALAAPLVLLVAALVIVVLAMRVTDRPAT